MRVFTFYDKSIHFTLKLLIGLFVICLNFIDLQSAVWNPVSSPYGGMVSDIIYHNQNLYAIAPNSGVYLSTDNGDTWQNKNNNILELNSANRINKTNEFLFVSTSDYGLFRANFNDLNWQLIFDPVFEENKVNINKISVEESGLYLCTNVGLFTSSDDGSNWSKIPTHGLNQLIVDVVEYEGNLYLINNDGVFVSSNNGESWNRLTIGNTIIYKIFRFNNHLHFCLNDFSGQSGFNFAVFRKDLKSDTIRNYFPAIFENHQVMNHSIEGDEIAFNLLQAYNDEYNFKVAYSSDKMESIKFIYDSTFKYYSFFTSATAIAKSRILLGTSRNGVFSIDLPKYETKLNKNFIKNSIITSLLINDDISYAATQDNGIYSSTDKGLSWTFLINSPKINDEEYVTVSKIIKHKNLVIIGTDRGIYSSSNDGTSWVSNASDIFITDLYSDGSFIYAIGNLISGQLMISIDDGKSWSTKRLPSDYLALGLLKNNSRLVVNTSNGIYFTDDNGETWIPGLIFKPKDLYKSPIAVVGNTIVSAINGNIYLSFDNAYTWTSLNKPFGTEIVTDLRVIKNIIIASTFNWIYFSLDDGNNWSNISEGLPSRIVSTMYSNQDTCYAAVVGHEIHIANLSDFSQIKITNVPSEIFCAGMQFQVNYEVKANLQFNEGNIFNVELSDANGYFSSDNIIIGTVMSSTNGSITVTIPENIEYGNKYRIRIVSTEPKITGIDNLRNLTILERKRPEISGNVEACANIETFYSSNINLGYEYSWSIENGTIISGTGTSDISVKWNNPGQGKLKLTHRSIQGCTDSVEISVKINPTPTKPIITKIGDELISSASNGNIWYLDGIEQSQYNSDRFSPDDEGIYQVAVINEFGCKSEMSDAVEFIRDENLIVFAIDTISANSGEDVYINIRLIKNKKFNDLKPRVFQANISNNSTLLYPLSEDKGFVLDGKRYLEIQIDTNYISSNIVKVVAYKSMLGNSESSIINLSNIKIDGEPLTDYKVYTGKFNLLNICYDGGPRLISDEPSSSIISVYPAPASNSVNVSLLIASDGIANLKILNLEGQIVQNVLNEIFLEGLYDIQLDISKLPIGEYYFILDKDGEKNMHKFVVTR